MRVNRRIYRTVLKRDFSVCFHDSFGVTKDTELVIQTMSQMSKFMLGFSAVLHIRSMEYERGREHHPLAII